MCLLGLVQDAWFLEEEGACLLERGRILGILRAFCFRQNSLIRFMIYLFNSELYSWHIRAPDSNDSFRECMKDAVDFASFIVKKHSLTLFA